MRPLTLSLLLGCLCLAGACGGGVTAGGASGGSSAETGGAKGSGGSGGVGTGGATTSSGGAGGTLGAGGATSSGGAVASGGITGPGGATSLGGGGATGDGGAKGNGGTMGTAGATSTGGVASTGGVGGTTGGEPVAFKGVANSPCGDLATFKVGWYYNWTTSPAKCKTPEFVPMISGKNEKTPEAVTSAINNIAKAGYKTVLGFNEPNKSDQSNLTVAEVVAMWPALTANADVRVGSPATSADAQSWFNDFMTQVTSQSLRVDFIALHWYGWNAGSCDAKAASLESYIKWAEGLPGNRPLWLTEWGCMNKSNPDAATVQAFYAGALAVFAKHPRIERYAWYPWNTNNELVDSADALTPLGTAFTAAPTTR